MRSLFVLVLLGTGCINVASERAKLESNIGSQTAHGYSIEVEDGLASIRAMTPDSAALWAQAPTLTIQVTMDKAQAWTLELKNAMPEAVLTGAVVTSTTHTLATQKKWKLALPAGESTLRIAPDDSEGEEHWRFAIFADVQSRIDGVQDLFKRLGEEPGIRFGLISGDLTEMGSVEELTRFQKEMETLPFPLFATLGNHELGAGTDSPPFHELFGRGNLSFVFRKARFTLLDAASATISPEVYTQLDTWLQAGANSLHLAMMHIPPLDPAGFRNGAFASRAEANKLLSLFREASIDLTVYGHVHTYHAFQNAGIDALISGGGGAIPEKFDGIGRHFIMVDARPSQMQFVTSVIRIKPEE